MNHLIEYDIALFSKINGQWHNGFLDWLMPLLRNPFTWAPLYLFTVVFMLINFKWKGFWWICLFLITFAITDMVSSSLIKPMVGRLRPCHNPMLASVIRSVVSCGGAFSFPSSHAANHFGLAMFGFRTLSFISFPWKWLLFLWALSISYAQVYVGVHFPIDIICGTLLGCIAGFITSQAFNKRAGFAPLV